jgi:uncharacterized membrane protein
MGVYLLGMFGGYTALMLAVGYVMLTETNEWLRKSAVKALALTMLFSVISVVIGFLPDVLGVLNSFLNTFEVSFRYYWLTSLLNAVQGAMNICKVLLFANLAAKAYHCADVPVKPIDDLIAHMDTTSADAE